jgi:hypothetical protein
MILFKAGGGFETALGIAGRIGDLFSGPVGLRFGGLDCLLCFEI